MARVLGLLKTGGWMKVGDGFDDVNAFVRSLQLDQFKIVTEQRKEFVERVKALQPAVSNRAIADALGVDHQTINNDVLGENSPPGIRKVKKNGKWGGENSPPGACQAVGVMRRALSNATSARKGGRKSSRAWERRRG